VADNLCLLPLIGLKSAPGCATVSVVVLRNFGAAETVLLGAPSGDSTRARALRDPRRSPQLSRLYVSASSARSAMAEEGQWQSGSGS
jgi:hypothetical protein